jgi:hypothetical protein
MPAATRSSSIKHTKNSRDDVQNAIFQLVTQIGRALRQVERVRPPYPVTCADASLFISSLRRLRAQLRLGSGLGRCVGTRRDGDSLDMARSRMRRQHPADERPGPCTGVLAQQRRKHSTGCRQAASPEERRGGWVPVGLVSPGRGGAAAGASWSCTGGNRVDVMRTPS